MLICIYYILYIIIYIYVIPFIYNIKYIYIWYIYYIVYNYMYIYYVIYDLYIHIYMYYIYMYIYIYIYIFIFIYIIYIYNLITIFKITIFAEYFFYNFFDVGRFMKEWKQKKGLDWPHIPQSQPLHYFSSYVSESCLIFYLPIHKVFKTAQVFSYPSTINQSSMNLQ